MISILLGCRGSRHIADLLRSLSNNASSRDSYEVCIKLDDDDPELVSIQNILASFGEQMTIKSIVSPRGSGYSDLHKSYMDLLFIAEPLAKVYWVLSDDVLILGASWDKYIHYYADNNKMDDLFVIIPSTMIDYSNISSEKALDLMDNYPIWSRKWVQKVGFGFTFSTDGWTNLILRELFVDKRIDKRIHVRHINLVRKNQPEDFPGSERYNTTRKEMIEKVLSPQGKTLLEWAVDNVTDK